MRTRHYGLVAGYYGMSNFGDDLFVKVLRDNLPRAFPDVRPLFMAPVSLLPASTPSHPTSLLGGWFDRPGVGGSLARLAFAAKTLHVPGPLFLGGGSTLQDVTGTMRLGLSVRSRSLFMLGVSLGPFSSRSAQDRVATAVRSASGVWVRDAPSLERATAFGAQAVFGGDLAGLLEMPRGAEVDGRGGLGLAPSSAAGAAASAEQTVKFLTLAERAVRKNEVNEIVVFALNGHPVWGDVALASQAVDALRERRLPVRLVRYETQGLMGVIEEMQNLKYLDSGRLHGGVVAFLAGVPFRLLEHHAKCADFLDDVGQPQELRIGSMSGMGDLDSIDAPRMSVSAYKSRAHAALEQVAAGY